MLMFGELTYVPTSNGGVVPLSFGEDLFDQAYVLIDENDYTEEFSF